MSEVTRILSQIESGDSTAAEELLPLVYDELRKLAVNRIEREKPGQTLQATTLVYEAYIRLVNVEVTQKWNGRGQFFAAAAEAMRRILVERARRKKRIVHGGEFQREDVNMDAFRAPNDDDATLLDVHEALDQFAELSPRRAELVKLRYFLGGLPPIWPSPLKLVHSG